MPFEKQLIRNTKPLPTTSKCPKQAKTVSFTQSPKDDICYDSISEPQKHTTLRFLKEIEDLKFQDLHIDVPKLCPVSGVQFDASEKLYSDLIDLNVYETCAIKKKRNVGTVIMDETPNEDQFLQYALTEPYVFNEKFIATLPEKEFPPKGHSLWKLSRQWKKFD